MKVLYLGPGHSPIVRARVAPFADEVDGLWVTTEPVPQAFRAAHPRLRIEVLPRPVLRRLPRRLYLHTLDYVAEVLDLIARRFRPDLIHLHYASQLDALALAPVRRTPILVTVMGADVLAEQVPRPLPLDLLVQGLFCRAAGVTAKSAFLEAACRALGAPAERIHRVPWGVPVERFTPGDRDEARRRLGLPAGEALVASSRALHALYNHLSVVEAAGRLGRAPDGRPLRLVLVRHAADPDYARRVEAAARERGLAVSALPPQEAAGMADLYRAADVVASVPRSDGLPQTLLEALACERPVVTLDLPAYAELPFGPGAQLRAAHAGGEPDLDALTAALERALAGGDRPDLGEARGWIEEHMSFERSVAQVRRLYAALAGAHGPG